MTFYQELQLNQAGSKNLLKKSETLKEKLYHMWVYLVKIAATMAFCFFFVSIFSILYSLKRNLLHLSFLFGAQFGFPYPPTAAQNRAFQHDDNKLFKRQPVIA